ncbi:hypothetical protein IW140_005754 [Coemansia sp. RSA 1813]|nr:hypothetical protein EV178_002180 [Coemansia sp. RSA 1646]KAJ1767242.1 hypothetical protein LPJ74_005484 [Coemansia sp. RSA 1843]KAJ2090320.1 hypothetical protein IW138_002746 [Coemansia sp. RSA 986]KAJ2215510.1 hypothetical protein EV179_002103 [Coemansia sp. RSA 487]KAJ2564416.1 hypothetical protein IW140_005754 [Coemansia sp. RSA 1813]
MLARDSAAAVLHPLVLLNISEHATRMAALVRCNKGANTSSGTQAAAAAALPPLAVGALLGNQVEGRYEVFLSFELKVEKVNGEVNIDSQHFEIRLDQLRVIFPNHEFIGWYVASSSLHLSPLMLELHTKLVSSNPSALLLVFDASLAGEQSDGLKYSLPVAVYETKQPMPISRAKLQDGKQAGDGGEESIPEYYVEVFDENRGVISGDQSTVMASKLAPMRIVIESGEAERIATEHVANISRTVADDGVATVGGNGQGAQAGPASGGVTGSTPQIATFLASQRIAIEMLRRDLGVLKTYVGDVINGKAPFDPDVLQIVQRVLSNRPVVKDDAMFELAMAQEETNYQMASYLASITKAVASVRTVSFRANTALEAARITNTPKVNPNQDSMFDLGMGGMMTMMGGSSGSGMGRRLGGRSRGFGGDMR